MGQVTSLLSAIGQGERQALGELYALLYPELRRLAHSRVSRSGELTLLDTTSLVHESYLRFEKSGAVALDEAHEVPAADPHDSEVLRLHESLEALAAIDERVVRVVEMRYFAGMTEADVAGALGLAVRTVARDWEKARLFLHASLR